MAHTVDHAFGDGSRASAPARVMAFMDQHVDAFTELVVETLNPSR
jgi:hypothetical protein